MSITGAAIKAKSEERRRAWLAAQGPAQAKMRLAKARELLGKYASEPEDEAVCQDENAPIWTQGDLASRIEEHIARAAHVGAHELPVDAGTLGVWLANLPLNGLGQTLATVKLRDLSVPAVYAHLLSLELPLAPALARAIARRTYLVAVNKRNATENSGSSFLRGPFWLHREDGKKKKAKPEALPAEPQETKPPMPPPSPQRTLREGPALYTIIDVPEGPTRGMCFACGDEGGRSNKRRVTVQFFGHLEDPDAAMVEAFTRSIELAKQGPPQAQCPKCGEAVALLADDEAPEKSEPDHPRDTQHADRQREVVGMVRVLRNLTFYMNDKYCTLESGTLCEKLRLSGKEMFPPNGGEELAGIRWEGRLRLVPVSSVEVVEAEA